jgi:hypothetical protein
VEPNETTGGNGSAGSAGNASVFLDPSKRQIFKYHDGRQWRLGDPLAIARALLCESEGFDADAKLIESGEGMVSDEMRLEALGRVSAAAYRAFGVAPLSMDEDGNAIGMTEAELKTQVLQPFFEYLTGLKKNGSS